MLQTYWRLISELIKALVGALGAEAIEADGRPS